MNEETKQVDLAVKKNIHVFISRRRTHKTPLLTTLKANGSMDWFRKKRQKTQQIVQPKTKFEEIQEGGWKGCLGLDQLDWGSDGGQLYELWVLDKCCGDPECNAKDASTCIVTWYCCPWCAFGKLYSKSMGSDCSLIPHCIFSYFCPFCACAFTRYNLRKRFGIPGNLMGDCLCTYGCFLCVWLQHLRAVPNTDWKLWPIELVPVAPKIDLLV